MEIESAPKSGSRFTLLAPLGDASPSDQPTAEPALKPVLAARRQSSSPPATAGSAGRSALWLRTTMSHAAGVGAPASGTGDIRGRRGGRRNGGMRAGPG